MANKVLTHNLDIPRNGAKAAKIDIQAGDGNLTIDQLAGDEQILASGALQYLEKRGLPERSIQMEHGRARLTLQGSGGQRWFHLPWSGCNGATEWQIHLNPEVRADITAHSDGGNVRLDLANMDIEQVRAETGGGNVELVLPENTADLQVTAKTGAGNVVLRIPVGVAARIHAKTGLGNVVADARFGKVNSGTYQSPDYDASVNTAEISASSGAGNVIIESI